MMGARRLRRGVSPTWRSDVAAQPRRADARALAAAHLVIATSLHVASKSVQCSYPSQEPERSIRHPGAVLPSALALCFGGYDACDDLRRGYGLLVRRGARAARGPVL